MYAVFTWCTEYEYIIYVCICMFLLDIEARIQSSLLWASRNCKGHRNPHYKLNSSVK